MLVMYNMYVCTVSDKVQLWVANFLFLTKVALKEL